MKITHSIQENGNSTLYSESVTMKNMVWVLLPFWIAVNLVAAVSNSMPLKSDSINKFTSTWDQYLWLWQNNFWEIATPNLIFLLVYGLFRSIRLRWTLSPEEFTFSYFPFVWKEQRYSFSEIQSIEVKKINALKEFGGWGLRRGRLGKAYTTGGSYILHVALKSSTAINVSVLRPKQAEHFIQNVIFKSIQPN